MLSPGCLAVLLQPLAVTLARAGRRKSTARMLSMLAQQEQPKNHPGTEEVPVNGIEVDAGRHTRAKLGFVLLATEQTIQHDMHTLLPWQAGVGVHFTRATIPDSITPEALTALGPSLRSAAALMLPAGGLDVLTYACTSGSLVLGEEHIYKELRAGLSPANQNSTKLTCLLRSVLRALEAVHASQLVVMTPYLDSINRLEKECLESEGYSVLDIQGLRLEKDSDIVRVTSRYILEFAAALDRVEADTIFISCGALRSTEIIEELEKRTGKTVLASNQCMAWDMMRSAGIMDQYGGYGVLLREH